jgi:ribonuclease HI
MEVYDAEIHAVAEGLQAVEAIIDSQPRRLTICTDNSAAVLALTDTKSVEESTIQAKQIGQSLTTKGGTSR